MAAAYFITLVTRQRACLFGQIDGHTNSLNLIGELIRNRWCDLPNQFDFISLGEYVIMPNHAHGIIWIHQRRDFQRQDTRMHLPHSSVPPDGTKPASLSSIIQNYKSVISREVNSKFGIDHIWQRAYHDRIIRNERELAAITEYIIANPANWLKDQEYRS